MYSEALEEAVERDINYLKKKILPEVESHTHISNKGERFQRDAESLRDRIVNYLINKYKYEKFDSQTKIPKVQLDEAIGSVEGIKDHRSIKNRRNSLVYNGLLKQVDADFQFYNIIVVGENNNKSSRKSIA
jgi:hypothetical protein